MPPLIRLLTFSLLLGATFPLPALAGGDVAAALALARQGEFVRAAELLEGEGSPASLYYAGWMRAQAGDWRAAGARWTALPAGSEWARKAADTGAPHLLEVSLRLYRAGDPAGAIEAAELSERLGGSSDARELARIARQRRDSREGGASGWISVGAGYNSNLFGDGLSEIPLGTGFTDFDASLRGTLSRRFFAELSGRWQEFLRAAGSRYVELEGRLGVRARMGAFDSELGLGADYENIGSDADAVSPGAFVRFRRRYGNNLLELEYELSQPLVAHDEFQHLHAPQHELTASLTALRPGWAPFFEAELRRQSGGDIEEATLQLPLEHVAIGATAGASAQAGAATTLGASLAVEHRIYDQKAFPGLVDRRDWTYSLSLFARRELGGALSGFASGKSEINRSTLGADDVDDKNSFVAVLSAGLEWRI